MDTSSSCLSGDTTNVEDEILQSRFKDIWSIILALKSQDDLLRETLDQLRIEIGKNHLKNLARTNEDNLRLAFKYFAYFCRFIINNTCQRNNRQLE